MRKWIAIMLILVFSTNINAQSSPRDVAIARAKAVFIATANGDVATTEAINDSRIL